MIFKTLKILFIVWAGSLIVFFSLHLINDFLEISFLNKILGGK